MANVGDEVLVTHEVRDLEGDLSNAATVTLTVTRPDLSTVQPAVTNPPEDTGLYEVGVTLTTAGRYIFSWVTTSPATASASAVEATQPSNRPDINDVIQYLGPSSQHEPADVLEALNAETAAQAAICRIGAEFPPDLAEALKRRVARNLAMKALPLGLQASSESATATTRVGADAEIQRLEDPHRQWGFA